MSIKPYFGKDTFLNLEGCWLHILYDKEWNVTYHLVLSDGKGMLYWQPSKDMCIELTKDQGHQLEKFFPRIVRNRVYARKKLFGLF